MKFVHIADMHFDSPFTTLSRIDKLGNKRRLEQRDVFHKMIEYVKENKIPYLLIAGDLYEHEYIRKSTIDFINQEFAKIPDTKIFIAPGNHDPYLKNSYYVKYEWSPNVHIFGPEIEKIETKDAIIYGYGFGDFYCRSNLGKQMIKQKSDKPQILLIHGSLDAGTVQDQEYNPMKKKELEQLGFSYIALGHIHKNNRKEQTRIIYPGSMISFGFDELGKHGMIVGEIDNEKIQTQLIPLDEREFIKMSIDISSFSSPEELIEAIQKQEYKDLCFYEILLEGRRNFEIDILSCYSSIENSQILKIKDHTKTSYDLDKIKEEESLRGIFVSQMLQRMKEAKEEERQIIQKAIEIGLDTLEG